MSTAVDAAPRRITFYDSGTCPYAHRTWLALEEKLLPYETIKVDLQNKSKVWCYFRADESCPGNLWLLIGRDIHNQ